MVYSIENSFFKVKIAAKGAELISVKNGEQLEYIWQADPAVWPRHAPVLFPIVGKLKNNTYRYKDKSYSLPQHGFARDKDFECIHQDHESIQLRLEGDDETWINYPFSFELITTYRLQENRLSIEHKIINHGEEEMYFSIGAHPGFTCPLNEEITFEDYFLEFDQLETFKRHKIKDSLYTGEQQLVAEATNRIPLNKDLFREDALVFKGLKSKYVSLKNEKDAHAVRMNIEDFPYLGIWTKMDEKASFVCLEPWLGLADSHEATGDIIEKEGIIMLKAKEHYSCNYDLSFF